MKQMNEYNLVNEKGQIVKKYGFSCPDCGKVYSEVALRYDKRVVTCACGTKLTNPKR